MFHLVLPAQWAGPDNLRHTQMESSQIGPLIDPNGDAGGNVVGIDNEDNTLIGLGGDDFLSGANLNDTLFGGAGNDFLSGGDGRDVFVMQHNPFGPETFGTDEVTDFSATDDRIDLTELRIGEYETLFAVMADTPGSSGRARRSHGTTAFSDCRKVSSAPVSGPATLSSVQKTWPMSS